VKKADIIEALRQTIDVDTAYASNLKMTLTDNEVWKLFMQAVPQLPQYRQSCGLSIYEQQFRPYYDPDTNEISINPLEFFGASGVVIDDSLYLSAPPGSGWIETTPGYERVNTDEAKRIKDSDFGYKRNLYYFTESGGYVSLQDYDQAVHGVTDGNFYRLKKYPGILAVKVEMVTADASGRTVGFDLSLDGGRSWIGSAVGCVLDTEIDVSAYPSTSPVLKIILGSPDSISPKVLDLRMMIWQVENLEANMSYILEIAHAIWLERLADRAGEGEGSQELLTILAMRATEIRQRVAGVIGSTKVPVPQTRTPSVAAGPANRYSSKFFKGRR
jgi:hypothetical protein